MSSSLKTNIKYSLILFCAIVFLFPTITLAEDPKLNIGEKCTNNLDLPTSECASGDCEDSSLTVAGDNFCVCKTQNDCELEASLLNGGISDPNEIWECKDGAPESFDLHYCESSKGAILLPLTAEEAAKLEAAGAGGCTSDANCPGNQYCNNADKSCVDKIAIGQQCPTDITHCISGICENKIIPPNAPQDICICKKNDQCPDGKYCADGTGLDSGLCVDKLGKDADCNINNEAACQSGKCEVTPPSTAGKCTEPAAAPVAPTAPTSGTSTPAAAAKLQMVKPKINIPIPGLADFETQEYTAGETVSIPWIAQYIVAVYSYAIILGAILAVLIFMFGGIIYITSGGSSEFIQKGKTMMFGAVSGIVVLLSAYLILNIINPNLVKLSGTTIETVKPIGNIIEGEWGSIATVNPTLSTPGNLPYYYQFDSKWACFPLTGNKCSYQDSKVDGETLSCGIPKGYKPTFPGVSTLPWPAGQEKGITVCREKSNCEAIEATYHVSEMCKNPNLKDAAWCEKNPYGKNNFVAYCKNVTGTTNRNVNNIQASGCGLTSTAMVATFNGLSVIPPDVARWVQENGIRSPAGSVAGTSAPTCCGVDNKGIEAFTKGNGLDAKQMSQSNKAEIKQLLSKGIPIIFHVKTKDKAGNKAPCCPFTAGGHYIVVANYDGTTYQIHDPSHKTKNECGGDAKTATETDLWDACGVYDIVYIYQKGNYGKVPELLTSDPGAPSGPATVTAGACHAGALDLSPYSTNGCYDAKLSCTPEQIKSTAMLWGNSHIVTAPNTCALIASRIIRNAGCKIPGFGSIGSAKDQLTALGWKGLIVGGKGGAAQNYYSQMPVGLLYSGGFNAVQHVSISTGQGGDVESSTVFSACQSSGCSQAQKTTCAKNATPQMKTACLQGGMNIPNMNAVDVHRSVFNCGETPDGDGGFQGEKNQCIAYTKNNRIKGVNAIFFPVINPADTTLGCCKSDLILHSKYKTNDVSAAQNGISVNKPTCDSLFGSWSSGGSCLAPYTPHDIITSLICSTDIHTGKCH